MLVKGVVFRVKKADGDFQWMAKQAQYNDSVFLIMENFLDMLFATQTGGGTAVLRDQTWPMSTAPRAVGIPTGYSQETGGFRMLDKSVREIIDLGFERLRAHVREVPNVRMIVYSADGKNPSLIGCNIFKATLSQDVLQYITQRIHEFPSWYDASQGTPQPNTEAIREKEYGYVQLAQALHERDIAISKYQQLRDKVERESKQGKIQGIGELKRSRDAAFGGAKQQAISAFVKRR